MIRILDGSEGNIVAVQASEKLTEDDYKETLVPALRRAVEEHGTIRALLYFDDTFRGWEAAALWEDAKLVKHAGDFEKLAIVGGPDWVRWSIKLFRHFMKGEVKVFQGNELDVAWAWIK